MDSASDVAAFANYVASAASAAAPAVRVRMCCAFLHSSFMIHSVNRLLLQPLLQAHQLPPQHQPPLLLLLLLLYLAG